MSQEAYTKFAPQVKAGGILITENELVQVGGVTLPENVRMYGVPATRLAEEIGRKVVLNIVMVGFLRSGHQPGGSGCAAKGGGGLGASGVAETEPGGVR